MPPIINPIYTKDFPPLGRDGISTDLIPVAIAGNPITYVATLAELLATISPALSFGTFGSTPNAQGGSYSGGVITLQPASLTHPGGVSTAYQEFSGQKVFTAVQVIGTSGSILQSSSTTGVAISGQASGSGIGGSFSSVTGTALSISGGASGLNVSGLFSGNSLDVRNQGVGNVMVLRNVAGSPTLTVDNAGTTTLTGSISSTPQGTLYGTATGSITSAQLATSLTDETGTGSAVFSNAPTLTSATFTTDNTLLTRTGTDQYYRANFASSTARKGLYITNSIDTDFKVYSGGSQTLGAFTEGTDLMVIGTGFNGGGSSSDKILFHSTGRGNMFSMNSATSINTSYFPLISNSFIPTSSTVPTNGMYLGASNQVDFATNSTNKLSITSGGYVGQGTTSPSFSDFNANTLGYHVYQNSINGAGFKAESSNASMVMVAGNNQGFLYMTGSDPMVLGTNNTAGITLSAAQAVRFNSYGAGTLTTDASGNITATSDERMKNISGFYTTGLSALSNIKPITYKWKSATKLDTKEFYTGFSAQNIHQNIPQASGKMANGDLTIQDRPIMATMVNGINELHEIIKKQDARILELEKLYLELKK